MQTYLLFAFSDFLVFPTIQLFLTLAFLSRYIPFGDNVTRGEKSYLIFQKIFYIFFAVLVSLIIVNVEYLVGYKAALILVNLYIAFDLCFINPWFQNKIIGFYVRHQTLMDKLFPTLRT